MFMAKSHLPFMAFGIAVALDGASEWEAFKLKYDRKFSDEEEHHRFRIFNDSLAFIKAENAKHQTFTLGINDFADLAPDEFRLHYTGLIQRDVFFGNVPSLGNHSWDAQAPLADAIDWVEKGGVTPIKNQGSCGSCWAFSTVGALEGAMFVATQKLAAYSEQDFVDCASSHSISAPLLGCKGGLMTAAFKWAENHDICTEDSYPYKAVGGHCKAGACTTGIPKGTIVGFKALSSPCTGQDLMSALMLQPVSVGIMASGLHFQLYKRGVLSGFCTIWPGGRIDHGVLAVGYGRDGKLDYWRVKNSWGKGWGEHGYIRLDRAAGGYGECHVLAAASYPVVKIKQGLIVV